MLKSPFFFSQSRTSINYPVDRLFSSNFQQHFLGNQTGNNPQIFTRTILKHPLNCLFLLPRGRPGPPGLPGLNCVSSFGISVFRIQMVFIGESSSLFPAFFQQGFQTGLVGIELIYWAFVLCLLIRSGGSSPSNSLHSR